MGESSSPGAMTSAMRAVRPASPAETWARVAVVRQGRIAPQRWLRPGETLTWGSSERADVVVVGAPREVAGLLAWRDGALVIDRAIGGRLGTRGRVIDRAPGDDEATLAHGARARLRLAPGVEVLIEMTQRPPVRRRVPLPRELGGGLGIDQRFTAFAVGSLMLHAAFVTVLVERDWPATTPAQRLAMVIYDEVPLPPVIEDVEPPDAPSSEDAPASDPIARAPIAPSGTPAPRSRSGEAVRPSLEALRGALDQALDAQLGALAAGGALDVLAEGAPRASHADVLDGISRAVADGPAGGGVPSMRRGGSLEELARGCADCGAIAARRVGPVREGAAVVAERAVRVSVPAREIEDDDAPGLDPAELARALRGRTGAVRACYERALRDEPTLAGRIDVEVRVEQTGTLSGVRVRDGSIGDAAFHECVARALRTVRLRAGPEGGAAVVSFPFVLAPQ